MRTIASGVGTPEDFPASRDSGSNCGTTGLRQPEVNSESLPRGTPDLVVRRFRVREIQGLVGVALTARADSRTCPPVELLGLQNAGQEFGHALFQ